MFLLKLCLISLTHVVLAETNSKAVEFTTEFNRRALLERNKLEIASWRYSCNVSSAEAAYSMNYLIMFFLCVFLFLRTLCHSIYTAHEYQPCNCVLLYRCDHSHYLG